MKKRNILITAALAGVLSLGACGKTELKPLAEQVEVELGGSLDENVTSYAALDEKAAKEATLDLSAVDTNKTGTYPASVTYKEQTAAFGVVVKDTTAPEVALKEKVTVAAGMPLHAKDVIAEVTELSGEATATFEQADPKVTEQPEGTEDLESTELSENTEALVPETENVTEPETGESAETFVVGDVTCTDDTVLFATVGSYDVLMTVADGSGNETEVKVTVIVGEAPEFSGIEDLTVTVGTESADYLDGVTATDYKGADITDRIVCDAAAVKLDTVGTYEILYTVADEEGFAAEQRASVTVAEKKAAKSSGKKTPEKNTASTGNTGTTNQPSGNTESTGNSGNATGGNTGNTGNGGNSGAANNNAGNTNPPSGNTGNSGNNGGTTTPPAGNNGGNAGNTGNGGSADNSGNNGGTTTPPAGNNGGNVGNAGNGGSADNSGNSGNNGGTTTPPAGSVTDPNTGMSVPGDIVIEDWGNMQGGADDGTDLGGGMTFE